MYEKARLSPREEVVRWRVYVEENYYMHVDHVASAFTLEYTCVQVPK